MANFTKQAIKASFIKLLNEQPLNKISVRSIVEDCGINRNSFYYHFQDIPSLIGEIVKEEIDALVAKYPTINSIDECVSVALKFTLENKRAVLHIYNSVNRDIYERYLMRICEYGKVRSTVKLPLDCPRDEALAAAKADERIAAAIAGKTVVKEITVPNKIINIVVR